jgi:hypothetical protein
LDWAFMRYNMDFDVLNRGIFGGHTIVQKFSEGTAGNAHYAFIPSRLSKGRSYREVFESPLHTTGTTIYYRWWKEKVEDGNEVLVPGDIHSFVNPRKITIAMLGDSFGSGEGAPNRNSRSPWIKRQDEQYWRNYDWIRSYPSHRSTNSGFELALKKWIDDYPDFAINFGNYSWSGATAYLPPIEHDKRYNSDRIEEENYWGPKTMWGQLTQLNNMGPNTTNESNTIDALFINMGGNDAGFGDIISAQLGGEFDITSEPIEDRMFSGGADSWIDIFNRTVSVWSDFFNANFNGTGEPSYVNNFMHVNGSTVNITNIHDIAWFNFPDVTAGSPSRVLDTLAHWGSSDDLSRAEFARIKPLIIDVLNQNMRDALGRDNTKITLYEHPEYVTGGLGIPYNYINDDIDNDGELDGDPKEYHTPLEYALRDGYEERTDPNRWYNHFFFYRDEFETNSEGVLIFGDLEPKGMGSFHPNENGYRNAYLPLYHKAFSQKLSPATLRQRAIEEGVDTYPDLVGESLSMTASKDQETGNYVISGQFGIKNLVDRDLYSEGFTVRINLKSDRIEYRDGRPLRIGNTKNVDSYTIECSPDDGLRFPINLNNPKSFSFTVDHSVDIFDLRFRHSGFHPSFSWNTDSITSFGAFVTEHIPQRYTVEGHVDSSDSIFEGIGENNNFFTIGDVYPDPSYDPEVQQSLRELSRKFEVELRGLVKEVGDDLPDSMVEELDPEWLEDLIERALGHAQIKERMQELTGFRKPDGRIENRDFEDGMLIPLTEMYRMGNFATAMMDREAGIGILSSMKGLIPLMSEDLVFDEIQFSHMKNQKIHALANVADALAESHYLMEEMEFSYFKYSENNEGLPEYKEYSLKLDTGGLFRGIRAEIDDKNNIVVLIDPDKLPDEIAKGPIQIKLSYDDPGELIKSIEREGIIAPTTIVIPEADWLAGQIPDGRGILVDVSVQKTGSFYGADIPIWDSLAGYRLPTESRFPAIQLPQIEDFGEPDPVNVFTWQTPEAGISPDWTHVRLRIRSGSKILFEEIAEYGDHEITIAKMYEFLAGYGSNLSVDFEAGNQDFSISSGIKTYPFHYPYKIPQDQPELNWELPREWTEGLPLTEDILNATASFGGNEIAGKFEYSVRAGETLSAGYQVLQATFIPSSGQYETAVISRLFNVLPSLSLIVLEDPFRLEFNSVKGHAYHIEVSDDLSRWTTVDKIVATGPRTRRDLILKPIEKLKFFRVRQEPN